MLCSMHVTIRRRMFLPVISVFLCGVLCLLTTSFAFAKGSGQISALSVVHGGKYAVRWKQATAPTDVLCRAIIGVPCYSPQEMHNAYDLTPVLNAGFVGKGQTIVIIDSFGSPTAEADLKQFDADYGLPDPPSFRIISPLGTIPFNPNNSDQVGWAFETSLDVQWAHAMAPGANIVLLTSPVSETEGVQGMPEFLKLEKYALDHHLGKIISQSWGATENTLFTPGGRKVLSEFEAFYEKAAFAGVTVLASAGDSGSANVDVNLNPYPFPTVIYPASSPWVTAVGGTSLYADTNGNYQSETVWNDGIGSATGGGVSQTFSEPLYQRLLPSADQKLLNGHRAIPDIAYNADPNTPVPVFVGFLPGQVGYYLFGGTSEGSPQWAGLIADANQYAGHPLGFLNPALYLLGASKNEAAEVFHDITSGNNAQPPVPGYDAAPGWDAVSGWGSPIAQPLIQHLARV